MSNPTNTELDFKAITTDDIEKIIDNFKPKPSTGHDNISMKFLKHCKDLSLTHITLIVKQMFTTGIFPERRKIAKVKPLYKKDDESILTGLFPYYQLFQKYLIKLYIYKHMNIFVKTTFSFPFNMD